MNKENIHLQTPQDKLRVALNADISTLNFASSSKGSKINASHAISMLFEGLTRRGENDILEPAIAEKYTVSPNKRIYTFYLRECYWSDGETIKSSDFAYAWKMCMNPNSKSLTISPFYYHSIKNAERYIRGQCTEEDIGISCPDDKTLIVELEYPAAYFLDLVSSPLFYPAPKHVAESNPCWAEKPGIICNGPFCLTSWKHESELIFKKNPSYWDAKNVKLEKVYFYIIPDGTTALNMFRKGELDWIGSPFYRLSYDISKDVLIEGGPDSAGCWISLNVEEYPLNNKNFRKALAYALNRKSIAENIFHHTGIASTEMLPKCMRLNFHGYFEDNDPDRAKTHLKQALEELGTRKEDLPEIEFLYVGDVEFLKRMTQAIEDQWKQVLGLKNIRIRPMEHNLFANITVRGNYKICISPLQTFVFDPVFFLNAFKERSNNINKTNWENLQFKKIFNQSENALGDIERRRFLIEAEALLMDEMPIIPVCSLDKRYAKNQKLKGERVSNLQSVDFKYSYFEK